MRRSKVFRYLLCCLLGISQWLIAQEKTLTLHLSQRPLREILTQLEVEADVSFSYESTLLDDQPPYTLDVEQQPLSECLVHLFAETPITYHQTGRVIILKRKTRTAEPTRQVQLSEVVITAEAINDSVDTLEWMAAAMLSGKQFHHTPSLLGEPDVVKTLQQTPGVSNGTEGLAGLYVRGGEGDDNLFLLDGVPIYPVNHVGGLFSAFHTDMVRSLAFYKSAFPARYGGRLSSVLDMNTRSGNFEQLHGSATLGLTAGAFRLEGPLIKERTSFHVGLRRSWLDLLSAPTLAIINSRKRDRGDWFNFRYAFHDLNVRLDHRLNRHNLLFLSLYQGTDYFKGGRKETPSTSEQIAYLDEQKGALRWGNLMATLGWRWQVDSARYGQANLFVTRYHTRASALSRNSYGEPNSSTYQASVAESVQSNALLDVGLRGSLEHRWASHRWQGGLAWTLHRYCPEATLSQSSNLSADLKEPTQCNFTNQQLWTHEGAIYGEGDFQLSPAMRINGGVRFGLFLVEQKVYVGIEPRWAMTWQPFSGGSVRLSYARQHQYSHLLSESYINLPTDAWVPSTAHLRPMRSDQGTLSIGYEGMHGYYFSMEGYYKNMRNLLAYKDDFHVIGSFADWEEKLTVGKGRAYGVEWLARKEARRWGVSLGYTLSWSDRQFAEIDNGQRFPSRYDNRHKVNLAFTQKLSQKVELAAAWTYSSGNHLTLSVDNYELANPVIPSRWQMDGYGRLDNWLHNTYEESLNAYGRRNNYQLPPYHRLDIGLTLYRPMARGRMGIWQVGLYNAYCRMNPLFIIKDERRGNCYSLVNTLGQTYVYRPVFKLVGIVPVIPSISYTYQF